MQSRFSSQKPSKDLKVYILPNKVLPKTSSLVTWILSLTHFLKTSATNAEFLHSKSEKKMSNLLFFRKKTLLSQSFSLDMWNAVLKTPLNMFRKETSNFLLNAQKSKTFGLCQIFFLEVLLSAGHVESLPGSSSFSFAVFADVKFVDLTPLACPFSRNMGVFR